MRNDIDHPVPEELRTDHLFILIGSNPLPNYAAAKLLWKDQSPQAKLHLVFSQGTRAVAERLIKALGFAWEDIDPLNVDESDPFSIHETVHQAAAGLRGRVGLNYTGGTKAMAVHACRALNDLERDCVYSYLDARTLEMVIGENDVTASHIYIGMALKISLKDLLELHGYHYLLTKKKRLLVPEVEPKKPEFLQFWGAVGFDAIDEWVRTELQTFNSKEGRYETRSYGELCAAALPCEGKFSILQPYYQTHKLKTFEDAAHHFDLVGDKDKKGSRLANWLHTYWLEDYVLMCVQSVAAECGIHETGKNVKPFDPLKEKFSNTDSNFEFDVYAVKGFQLFGISCTTESEIGELKRKLFEAYVRARQIGGDEARVGLVCLASDHPDSGYPKLKRQLKESWDETANMVEVFGASDLRVTNNGRHILQEQLKKWFLGRVVHD